MGFSCTRIIAGAGAGFTARTFVCLRGIDSGARFKRFIFFYRTRFMASARCAALFTLRLPTGTFGARFFQLSRCRCFRGTLAQLALVPITGGFVFNIFCTGAMANAGGGARRRAT